MEASWKKLFLGSSEDEKFGVDRGPFSVDNWTLKSVGALVVGKVNGRQTLLKSCFCRLMRTRNSMVVSILVDNWIWGLRGKLMVGEEKCEQIVGESCF